MLKVLCYHCKKHIYTFKTIPFPGMPVVAADFIPANDSIAQLKQNARVICPYCGGNFLVAGKGDGVAILTDKGIFPNDDQEIKLLSQKFLKEITNET